MRLAPSAGSLVDLHAALAVMQDLAASEAPSRLVLVTEGTQVLNTRVRTQQAGWWGLSRSARQEVPTLQITCIDIESGGQPKWLTLPAERSLQSAYLGCRASRG